MFTTDKVAIEQAVRQRLFGGQVTTLLSGYSLPGSAMPDKTGLALSDMLLTYAEHKIGAVFSTGSERLRHEQGMGKVLAHMKDIAHGNATALLRAADENIQTVLRNLPRSR